MRVAALFYFSVDAPHTKLAATVFNHLTLLVLEGGGGLFGPFGTQVMKCAGVRTKIQGL